MKTLLKLIILVGVAIIAWHFIEKNDAGAKTKLLAFADRIQQKFNQLVAEATTEEGENAGDTKTSLQAAPNQPTEDPDYIASDIQAQKQKLATQIVSEQSQSAGVANIAANSSSSNLKQVGPPSRLQLDNKGTKAENMEWIKALTQEYSPASWYLLMQYDHLPPQLEAPGVDGKTLSSPKPAATFSYLEGTSKLELLQSMATDVHEISHGYLSFNKYRYAKEKGISLNWDNAEGYFFLTPSISYFVSIPHKLLFPSKELVSEIPENLRTYRFNTYIDGETSTQADGVIGLLNEFHAYYLGSKFSYEMLKAYQQVEGSDAEGLKTWISNTQSSMTAYYEFNFFIMEYLLHMKKTRPTDYDLLKSNQPFVEAYAATHSLFKSLTISYQQKIESEKMRINGTGEAEVTIDNNTVWVREAGSSTSNGATIFSDDRAKLMNVLTSNRYADIVTDFGSL